jgi:hypothetical protein
MAKKRKQKRGKKAEENLLALLLEDISKVSGVDLGEILADTFPEDEPDEVLDFPQFVMRERKIEEDLGEPDDDDTVFPKFKSTKIFEEEVDAESLDLSNEHTDTADYFDDLFDDLDIEPADEEDIYA